MIKIIPYIFAIQLIAATALAANKKPEAWQATPVIHKLPESYAGESAVVIENNVTVDYKDEDDKELWMYRTSHRIVKVLDDNGVESYNKMSIPLYRGEVIVTLKARTILPDGKVIEITPDKMKESKDEDGSSKIVFAMDGLEKNAEIEMLLCYKKASVLFGKEFIQYTTPVIHATFELTSPSRLKFEEKGYNGFPSAVDTLKGDRRILVAERSDIPALRKETYSIQEINRMRADYKLSYKPLEKENVRMFTWQDLAQRLHTNLYQFTDKENKAVDKYLATIGITANDKEEDKIIKIEAAIKSGITLYKQIKDDNDNKLENVIDKKSATENNLIRLFIACFTNAGIKYELGITTNRNESLLDPDFENWNALEYYVCYFPNQKKFISPASVYYRYPFTSTEVLNNKGVFCKLTTLGNITDAIADIRKVTPEPAIESQSNIDVSLSFNKEMEITGDVVYSFSGYCAMGIREAVVMLPEEKRKLMMLNMISAEDKPTQMLKYSISGEGFENYYNKKPLLLSATAKMPQLVEKAGAKYLLKIGDVIGKQSEMYQDDHRIQPIDFEYPHYLNRTISVTIPDGYKILNPESITIHQDNKDSHGKVSAAFYSNYKLEENKLLVTVSEFYTDIHFPSSDYETFRKVINASADFNKVTLLLGKM